MISPTAQVLIPATLSFIIGIAITPIVSHYLYKYRAWKKRAGKIALYGGNAEEFNRLHRVHEVRAPRMGGIVVWASVLLTIALLFALSIAAPDLTTLNFLTRSETWVPLAALLAGAITGLIDDILVISASGTGLSLRVRIGFVIILSFVIGLWFWSKLGVTTVSLPHHGVLTLGILIVPLFILVSLGLFASGVIDGIDGLSGGVFAPIFAAYAIIAFSEGQVELAAFCASIVGGLLAFLWFNVPPARFYMTDTGTMALTLALAVVVFMTDALGGGLGLLVLPVAGFLLVVTVLSDVLQMIWKAFFHRKLLRIAPLHHHFEAIGWPGYKVVMRYWILAIVCAFAAAIFALTAK